MAVRFRLARVLRLRSQLRRQAQDDVARTQAALVALGDEIAAVRRAQEASRAAEEAATRRGVSGAELVRWRTYERALREREMALAAERTRVGQTLAQQREVLLGRRRQEKQLERLREKAADREEAAEERATMVALDDLVLRQRSERRER
jgi:flagellar export protein FliJ